MPQTRIRDESIPGWLAESLPDEGSYILRHVFAGEPGSAQAFQLAFDFLTRAADGRYSDRTLMTLHRLTRERDDGGDGLEPAGAQRAQVATLHREVSYDPDTEIKSGGTAALAVTIPAEHGAARLIMAVHPEMRRQGLGSCLLYYLRTHAPLLQAWVGSRNTVGHQFLLSQGMTPADMNAQRATLYTHRLDGYEGDEGVAR